MVLLCILVIAVMYAQYTLSTNSKYFYVIWRNLWINVTDSSVTWNFIVQ